MTSQEKKEFANEAYKAVDSPEVLEVMEEFAFNMHFTLTGLPLYGLKKIAATVATIARAQAVGVPLEELRLTDDETADLQMDLVKRLTS
jgi:hypothetical protein